MQLDKSKSLFGIMIIAVGIILLLNNLGIIEDINLLLIGRVVNCLAPVIGPAQESRRPRYFRFHNYPRLIF